MNSDWTMVTCIRDDEGYFYVRLDDDDSGDAYWYQLFSSHRTLVDADTAERLDAHLEQEVFGQHRPIGWPNP